MSEMNNYNYTPGELIALFIDGELRESERETLFDALAQNPELQAEFERALHIHHAVAQEVLKTVPPVALTNAVFAEAGFGVSSVSGASAVSVAKGGFLKMLLIPVLSAIFASAMTGLVLYNHFENKLEEVAFKNGALKENTVADSFTKEDSSSLGSTQSSDDKEGFRTSRNDNALTPSFTQAQRVGNLSSHSGMTRPSDDAPTRPSDDLRRFRANQNENAVGNSFKNNNDVILSDNEKSTSEEPRQNFLSIEKTEHFKNEQSFIKTEKADINPLQIPDFKNDIIEENLTKFSISTRRISSIKLFPDRTIDAAQTGFFKNMAIGTLYNFNENHALGGEAGQEDFPIYIADNSGMLQPTSSLFWAGAAYRYSLDGIDFLGKIQPFAQVLAGASRSGPIGKMAVGIAYRPFKNVSFSGNIEGTGLVYGYANELYSAGKIGASWGIGIEF